MYAIIETGGKQYKVEEGSIVFIEKLDVEADSEVVFDKVIAVGADDGIKVGAPYVAGATVVAKAVKNGKGKKITVATYKAKKNEKRNAFVEVEEPHAYTAEPIIKNEPEKQPAKPVKRTVSVPMDEDLGYITAPTIRLAASDEPEDEEEDVTESRISFDIPKTEEIKEVEVVYPDEPLFEEEAYTEEIEEAEDDEPPFDMDDDIEEDDDDEETSVMPAEGEIPDSYIAPPIEFLQESKTKDTRIRDNEEMRKLGIRCYKDEDAAIHAKKCTGNFSDACKECKLYESGSNSRKA